MAGHRFKITVEHLADPKGTPSTLAPLCFEAENHDNIVALAERVGIHDDDKLAFFVGLKLLGDAMLQDRDNPLYAEFLPAFGSFMKKFKSARQAAQAAEDQQK